MSAPPVVNIDHPLLSVLDAEIRRLAAFHAKTRLCGTTLVSALLVEDIGYSLHSVLGAKLRRFDALHAEGAAIRATSVSALFADHRDHALHVVKSAERRLAFLHAKTRHFTTLLSAPLALDVDHPLSSVYGANLRRFAALHAKRSRL